MISQLPIPNAPQTQNTTARSDAQNASGGEGQSNFGNVLAQQIDAKQNPKTPANQSIKNAQSDKSAKNHLNVLQTPTLPVAVDPATINLFGAQTGKSLPAAAGKDQEKLKPDTQVTPDASTQIAGLYATPVTVQIPNAANTGKSLEQPKTGVQAAATTKTSAHQVEGDKTAATTTTPKDEKAFQQTLKAAVDIQTPKAIETAVAANTTPSAQVIAQAAANAQIAPSNPVSSNTTVAAPVGSSAWPDEFAQKVSWVSTQQNQVAEIHLNPPDLGPVSVTLSVTDNQATAIFSSPHSVVRDAIENAMPKLRDSLAENGIMLGNTSVNDQAPRDNGASGFANQRENTRSDTPIESASVVTTSLPSAMPRRHNGMVDTFA